MPKTRQRALCLPAVHFKVEAPDVNTHRFHVTLTIKAPAALQQVSLPVWIPGSYLVREFSKNLQNLQVSQVGRALVVTQVDKNTWQVGCNPAKSLVLRYEIYALDNSVRTAWLDASRGFFNGTSLFLQVLGQASGSHQLDVAPPRGAKNWALATGLVPLKTDKNGFGSFTAANYDELADCPVEMGEFWRCSFVACGVSHRFVVAGAPPSFDGARLLADTQKICEAEIRFWHPGRAKPSHKNYLFMLNAVDDGYGGLEHCNSTALICNRKDLPRLAGGASANAAANATTNPAAKAKQPEGYTTLLGLISHEYFHTWNVKRLRPAEFSRYDYGSENYTSLLWFFEGFTSYYDDLLLRRAGLIDDATYLKLVNKTINQVMQTPGRLVQSVAQASFDAWVKYYRQDENTPNATVSYYTKGALVAMCLDLTLRAEGKTTLDAVMRALWLRCKAGPMTQADVAAVLAHLGGRSYAPELAAWVHGTGDLPLETLLKGVGVAVLEDASQMAQTLGLRVAETSGVIVKTVLRGGAAEQAGFAPGDEWLGVEVAINAGGNGGTKAGSKAGRGNDISGWRLTRLDDLALYAPGGTAVVAVVARDKRLLRLPLTLPKGVSTWRLVLREPKLVAGWLGG